MSLSQVPAIDSQTLHHAVADAVRAAILSGAFQPGQRLNQVEIAARLGTSRGPVREALRQLEEEGLIDNIPYRGTFVTQLTRTQIEEAFSIRRVLESFAVRRAAREATAADLQALQDVITAMRAAAAQGDRRRSSELDLQFHALLCHSAHHGLLLQLWKAIETTIRLFLAYRHRVDYPDAGAVMDTHPDILAALVARDEARAVRLLDDHIREAEAAAQRVAWPDAPQDEGGPP